MSHTQRGRGVLQPIGRNPHPEPAGWTLRDDPKVDSDDSTQPQDELHPSFLHPSTTPAGVNTAVNTTGNEANTSKRGRGVAKGTEFDRM
ncbi:hypothetical protein I3842_02G041700 [Carya illinoinensis]|uniref:Uncharacterized protein n=1 Tax=Carya illinoinensis TaxID=32201 RepID=A0A922FS71_CARIL|nr:hypothetical protein I3842_02G041700 [Carya illinoinensis]